MSFILTSDHHCVASAPEMQNICYSFFQHTGITAFDYVRFFDNGEAFSLSTHAEWQLHHFNSGYLATPPLPEKISGKKCSFVLSVDDAPAPFMQAIQDFRNILGIDYPFFMIERHQNFYDLYIFCTHVDNKNIINFYLNGQKYIEKFKQYFKSTAKNLLKDASKHKLIIPKEMQTNIDWLNQHEDRPDINPTEFIIHYYDRDISFTAKEAKCLKYLSIGYDTKGVANMMNISPRTVEFHINRIKSKMNVTTKTQILINLHHLEVQMNFW